MNKKVRIALAFAAGVVVIGLAGFIGFKLAGIKQSKEAEELIEQQEADLSGITEVASLTTVESLYHNVAQFSYEADEGLTGIWKHGYKKAWCEYDARVNFGIDASRVASKREGDTVTIEMPRATLIGEPKITKMGTPLVATGFLTDFTAEDEKEMIEKAQEKLQSTAQNDEALISQATQNAQKILRQWVQSMGKACGEDLTVEFEITD